VYDVFFFLSFLFFVFRTLPDFSGLF